MGATPSILIPKFERKPLFLRQFPGRRNFSKVSKDDLDLVLPVKDKKGWGHVGRLDAGLSVFAPDGELLRQMRWPARSYTRNMARILRGILGFATTLRTQAGAEQNTVLNIADANGLTTLLTLPPSGGAGLQFGGGAIFIVGDGVALEDHLRDNLVTPALTPVDARQGVRTTTQNTTTITLQCDAAISNGGSSSVNVTEIALFYNGIDTGSTPEQPGYYFLLAYDGVASTPVAAGGSVAPRYILDFPV
jgi:hypothetical protein